MLPLRGRCKFALRIAGPDVCDAKWYQRSGRNHMRCTAAPKRLAEKNLKALDDPTRNGLAACVPNGKDF